MPQFVALVALAFGLPLALLLAGASWRWLALGAVAWAAAVLLKAVLGIGVDALSRRLLTARRSQAAVWGFWSAVCELGVATAVVIAGDVTRVADVVALGVGAGADEVVFVVASAVLSPQKAPLASPGESSSAQHGLQSDWVVEWNGVLERFSTMCGHVGSRGLVWLGVQAWVYAPALLLSVATFALVDGVATFGVRANWNWSDPGVARRFQSFLVVVGAFELAVFAAGTLAIQANW